MGQYYIHNQFDWNPFCSAYAAVVIGFDPDSYSVLEDAGTATLTVRLLRGELQTEVSIQFFTSNGTAVGKLA